MSLGLVLGRDGGGGGRGSLTLSPFSKQVCGSEEGGREGGGERGENGVTTPPNLKLVWGLGGRGEGREAFRNYSRSSTFGIISKVSQNRLLTFECVVQVFQVF